MQLWLADLQSSCLHAQLCGHLPSRYQTSKLAGKVVLLLSQLISVLESFICAPGKHSVIYLCLCAPACSIVLGLEEKFSCTNHIRPNGLCGSEYFSHCLLLLVLLLLTNGQWGKRPAQICTQAIKPKKSKGCCKFIPWVRTKRQTNQMLILYYWLVRGTPWSAGCPTRL